MLRAFFVGLTALALLIVTGSVGEFLVPLVLGINPPDSQVLADEQLLESFMECQPTAYFIGLWLSNALGGLVGGIVLALGRLPRWTVWVVAAVAGLIAAIILPRAGEPMWFLILNPMSFPPGLLIGYRWADKSRALALEKAGK